MKIAICTLKKNGTQLIGENLCESDSFVIFDIINGKLLEEINNNFSSFNGSEIFCAQLLINKGIKMLFCINCENDSKKLFYEAGVEVIEHIESDLKELLAQFFPHNKTFKDFSLVMTSLKL